MREDVAVSLARVAAAAAAAAQEKANSCSFEDALKRFTDSNSVKQVPPWVYTLERTKGSFVSTRFTESLYTALTIPYVERELLHIRESLTAIYTSAEEGETTIKPWRNSSNNC